MFQSAVHMVGMQVRIEGIVQGVGFRPFVYALATRLGLAGSVRNDAGGVPVEGEGEPERVSQFLAALEREAPPLATIERVMSHTVPLRGSSSFRIAPSDTSVERMTLVSPDIATCDDCLRDLND